MKKKLLQVLCFASPLLLSYNSRAQTLIHYWHFNNDGSVSNALPNIPPIDADYSVLDTSKARIYYQALPGTSASFASQGTYRDFNDVGDTMNAQLGHATDPNNYAIKLHNPSDSMELLIYIPTSNGTTQYHSPILKFETKAASNGPLKQYYDYSTDSGSTWKTTNLASDSFTFSAVNTWYLVTETFDVSADNNAGLIFRIRFGTPNTGTAGNDEIDNVSVDGTSLTTSVNSISSNSLPCILSPNPANDFVNISTSVSGEKTYIIYNTTGQKVYTCRADDEQKAIAISQLSPGLYFINVQSTDMCAIMKFIKN